MGAACGSGGCVLARVQLSWWCCWGGRLLACFYLPTGVLQVVDGLLDVVNAGGEIVALLQLLYFVSEGVHGCEGWWWWW